MTVNIIYGHVEILQNVPVGNLLVAFVGDHNKIQEAIEYLRTNDVKIDSVTELLEEYVTKED